jgi:hypothetical protein
MRPRKWGENNLRNAVLTSVSRRQVLQKLGLVEAGGNYEQIKRYIEVYKLDTSHFLGQSANKGKQIPRAPVYAIQELLVKGNTFQSYKLKKRLFQEGLKKPFCELCGWAEISQDGRVPLELDHVNGDHYDNRIENLRILCPNCHSLQPTHRGKNKKRG